MVVLAVLNSELNHLTKYSYFYIFLSVDHSCIIVLLLKIVIEQDGKYKLRGGLIEAGRQRATKACNNGS
jgi:hypothetical protein